MLVGVTFMLLVEYFRKHQIQSRILQIHFYTVIGGLEVACWPFVPKFAGSNPVEAVGFLRAKKSSARLPSEGK
jgi:hypothetical protein